MVNYISLYGKEEMLLEDSMENFYYENFENKKVSDFLLNFQEGKIFVLIGEKFVQAFNFNYIDTEGALFLIKELNSQNILFIGSCSEKIAIQIYYLLQKCIELIKRESILYEEIDNIHKKFNSNDFGALIANLSINGQATDINYPEKYININNEIESIKKSKKTLDKVIKSITLSIVKNNKSKIEEITNDIYHLIPRDIHKKFKEKNI